MFQENIQIKSGRVQDACNHYFNKLKEQDEHSVEEIEALTSLFRNTA
jgi:hypothetical protein